MRLAALRRHRDGDRTAVAEGLGRAGSARLLYPQLLDAEGTASTQHVVAALRSDLVASPDLVTSPERGGNTVEALLRATREFAATDRARYLALHEDREAAHEPLARIAVLETAPLGLVAGAWLQWLSSPANAEDESVLTSLALYASDVGVGQPHASRGESYLDLMRTLRIAEYAAPPHRIIADRRIADEAFTAPAVLLAMSRFPDAFVGEILGADLVLRTIGLLPPLSYVAASASTVDWTALDLSRARSADEAAPADLCARAVDELVADDPGAADAVVLGMRWMLGSITARSRDVLETMRAHLLPAHAMGELLRARAREGSVYHDDFVLAGRSLREWLRQAADDPAPLVDALAASRLVKPGHPERSALTRGLVSEKGPMFRIFTSDDLEVIERWIRSLGDAAEGGRDRSPPAADVREPARSVPARFVEALRTPAAVTDSPPADLRDAFHLLLRRNEGPVLRAWGEDYVSQWLGRASRSSRVPHLDLPGHWRNGDLRQWLQTQHDRHAADFEAGSATPLPSREAVIRDVVQTAPLTLIDGSWLHGFTDYRYATSDVGFSLFETYWDELGNGRADINHPRIYRQVLRSMDVELPPTRDRAFADWPGFDDDSFALPVYWLAIGRLPRTRTPEILGLNLAMELSGVGGAYRRARKALKAHGFPTRFVDIHNTIDNVATGHAAWAADAVDSYVSGVDDASRGAAWVRVRNGFRSLSLPPPPRRLLGRRHP